MINEVIIGYQVTKYQGFCTLERRIGRFVFGIKISERLQRVQRGVWVAKLGRVMQHDHKFASVEAATAFSEAEKSKLIKQGKGNQQ